MAKKIIIFALLTGFLVTQIPRIRQTYSLSGTDILLINQRRSSYVGGRFLDNKATAVLNNFMDNFFESIDPNRYLFSSHPRERPDKTAYNIYITWPILIWLLLFLSFLF